MLFLVQPVFVPGPRNPAPQFVLLIGPWREDLMRGVGSECSA